MLTRTNISTGTSLLMVASQDLLDVEEDATLVPGYELKLNSYDLG